MSCDMSGTATPLLIFGVMLLVSAGVAVLPAEWREKMFDWLDEHSAHYE